MKNVFLVKLSIVWMSLYFRTCDVFSQNNLLASYADQYSTVQVLSSDESSVRLQFTLGSVYAVQNGSDRSIVLDIGQPIQEKGSPDLPKYSVSIAIDDTKQTSLEIEESAYWEITDIDISPSKGVLPRTINPASVVAEKNFYYQSNNFYPDELAKLSEPYILRDWRGQVVTFYPIQYNAVSKTLRIYYSIKLTVKTMPDLGKNGIEKRNEISIDREWDEIYKNHFLNYSQKQRYQPVEENGSILIITDPIFEDEIQTLRAWKIQKGIPVDLVNTTVTGTTALQIKNYIVSYFNTHPELKYILLVGDAMHIPPYTSTGSFQVAGPSDNFYGYLLGNDHYPEVFVGRFSAESLMDVKTQVQRTMNYEKNPGTTDAFAKGLTIASAEGPGDDNQMDFEHARDLRNQLLAYTYTHVDEMFDGSQGGEDLPGDPNPSMVVQALNQGRGVITYTGHGWDGGIASSGFSNAEIPLLSNTGKLPFFWSVACVNGEFMNTTCFAENLLRARNMLNQPIGAVAALMSTINQYWNEPMEGQDEMVALLTEAHASNIKRTFGGISMNGCMKMNDSYGQSGMDMTDTWTCFGDPSLQVRTMASSPMVVSHISTSPIGISSLTVSCNTNDALVSLTVDNVIIGTGIVAGGNATINFSPIMDQDTILVTVTAFNKTPYQGIVTIVPSYAGMDNISPHDLIIYPNPATDYVIVEDLHTNFDVNLYDLTGKLLYQDLQNTQFYIPTANFAAGMYVLKISYTNGKEVYQKLIKK